MFCLYPKISKRVKARRFLDKLPHNAIAPKYPQSLFEPLDVLFIYFPSKAILRKYFSEIMHVKFII